MGFFNFIQKRESQTVKVDTVKTGGADWLERALDASGSQNALTIGAVYRCVNLISDAVAVMPLQLKYRPNQSGVFRVMDTNDREHWMYLLNVRPNAWMNGYTLKKNIVMMMLLKGNAYLMTRNAAGRVVKPSSGEVAEVVLLQTKPVYDKHINKYLVTDDVYGINATYGSGYIIHIKNPSTDGGFEGESTIRKAARTLGIKGTGEKEQLRRMATGGRVKAILGYEDKSKSVGTYNGKQMESAATDLAKKLAEQDIVTLPDRGLALHTISMSSQDLQMIEQLKLSVKDIAMFFGVPIYKLGEATSNYKSIDASQVDFYCEAVQPICSQIETEMQAKVTTIDDWYKYKFDFDERPLFALDMTGKAAWVKARLETGIASVNDLRAEFDIEPVKEGDTLLMSANLKAIGTLANESKTNNVEPQNTNNQKEDESNTGE